MSYVKDFPSTVREKVKPEPSIGATDLMGIQKGRGVRVYVCPEADKIAALNVVAGYPPEPFPGGKMTGSRVIPLRHPEFPNAMLATSVSARSFGLAGPKRTVRAMAEITVEFATPTFSITGTDAFLSVDVEAHERAVLIPASCLQFTTAIGPVFDQQRVIKGRAIRVTQHALSSVDNSVIDQYSDCTNATAFRGNPPGTLLFGPATYSQQINFNGSVSIDLTYNFLYSRLPWNYEYVPFSVAPQLMTFTDGVTLRYPTIEFNALF